MVYRIFTISSGEVKEGALVEKLTLKGAGIDIPAIIVGEEGRGRSRGVLPVQLNQEQYKQWQEKGQVVIRFAEVGQTKAGKPKLFEKTEADTDAKILVVFRTKIGFRGGNSHTGDRAEEYWTLDMYFVEEFKAVTGEEADNQRKFSKEEVEELSPKILEKKYGPVTADQCRSWDGGFERHLEFAPFPGEILVRGRIAQGIAGYMGSGSQVVALVPKDVVFRTGYSGRLYGAPAAHYYLWSGGQLLALTWQERETTDLF